MSWRRRGVYVWRTRKPYALFGWSLKWMLAAAILGALLLWQMDGPWWIAFFLVLFSGRHTAYVGMTSSRKHRDEQHIFGGKGQPAKPWADLDPRVYAIPSLFPGWPWARETQEWLWIKLLLPVYNVIHNKHNPRRIPPDRAKRQRVLRESARTGGHGFAVKSMIMIARYALTVALWGGLIYGGWHQWHS